jgi:hypothetical protein
MCDVSASLEELTHALEMVSTARGNQGSAAFFIRTHRAPATAGRIRAAVVHVPPAPDTRTAAAQFARASYESAAAQGTSAVAEPTTTRID